MAKFGMNDQTTSISRYHLKFALKKKKLHKINIFIGASVNGSTRTQLKKKKKLSGRKLQKNYALNVKSKEIKNKKTKTSQIPPTSYQVLSKTGAEEFSLTLIIPKFGWIL